jgi:hypothetical protein
LVANRCKQPLGKTSSFQAEFLPLPSGDRSGERVLAVLVARGELPSFDLDRPARFCDSPRPYLGVPARAVILPATRDVLRSQEFWLVKLARCGFCLSLLPSIALAARGAESSASDAGAQTTSKPAVVSKMTDGTRRLVSNTKSMLMPSKPAPVRKSGTTAIHKKNATENKPGFFTSWFAPKPPQTPRTIKEWMALKQPKP